MTLMNQDYYETPKIEMGEGSYSANAIRVRFNNGGKITIGKYCSIAVDLIFYGGGNHRTDFITTFPFENDPRFNRFKNLPWHEYAPRDIHIGNDVWIGDEVVIMSGVIVGDGACIGAKSVVRSDVLPYTIVRGNPATLLRYRFTLAEVEKLLEMKWWDWTLTQEIVKILMSGNVEALYEVYKNKNGIA